MNDGMIEQIGTPDEIYNRPNNGFVANFVGSANLLSGTIVGPGPQDGLAVFQLATGPRLTARRAGAASDTATTVAVRTALIDIRRGLGHRDDRNVLEGHVRRRLFHGDFVEYLIDCQGNRVIVRRPPTEIVTEGEAVTVLFWAEHTILLDR